MWTAHTAFHLIKLIISHMLAFLSWKITSILKAVTIYICKSSSAPLLTHTGFLLSPPCCYIICVSDDTKKKLTAYLKGVRILEGSRPKKRATYVISYWKKNWRIGRAEQKQYITCGRTKDYQCQPNNNISIIRTSDVSGTVLRDESVRVHVPSLGSKNCYYHGFIEEELTFLKFTAAKW